MPACGLLGPTRSRSDDNVRYAVVVILHSHAQDVTVPSSVGDEGRRRKECVEVSRPVGGLPTRAEILIGNYLDSSCLYGCGRRWIFGMTNTRQLQGQ